MASDSQSTAKRYPPEGSTYTSPQTLERALALRDDMVTCPHHHLNIVKERLKRLRMGLSPISGVADIANKKSRVSWPYPRMCKYCSLSASCSEFLHSRYRDYDSDRGQSGWSTAQQGHIMLDYRYIDSMEDYWNRG